MLRGILIAVGITAAGAAVDATVTFLERSENGTSAVAAAVAPQESSSAVRGSVATLTTTPTRTGTPTETPTATPTSTRPYKIGLTVSDHYPSPAVSGNDKTWVFSVKNNGTPDGGCGPSPPASLNVTLTGHADSHLDYLLGPVPCPTTILVEVTSRVTAPPGGQVAVSGIVMGVPQAMFPTASAHDSVCLDNDLDKLCNEADEDDDNDGCPDANEAQTAPGSETTGGLRDPFYFWDFFDTPNAANARDTTIDLFNDIFRVAGRFGADDAGGTALINRNTGPLSPPPAAPAYHPAFDRDVVIGANPWNVAKADGVVDLLNDIFAIASQFGHDCS
ncbi:MAG: flexitail domain-containing putative surface protein [Dehalococcoidia bacterium]|nr:flexitail domain-containing putative surface protein [Dehalococcoidia bacterium]